MTNDLNTIPASVRDELQTIFSGNYGLNIAGGERMKKALPLIERLCQPNIVIVDLDDERFRQNFSRSLANIGVSYELYGDTPHDFFYEALAALKHNNLTTKGD